MTPLLNLNRKVFALITGMLLCDNVHAQDPCATIAPINNCGVSTNVVIPPGTGSWHFYPAAFNYVWGVTSKEQMYLFTPAVTGTHLLNFDVGSSYAFIFAKEASGGCHENGWTFSGIPPYSLPGSIPIPIPLIAGTSYYIILDTYNNNYPPGVMGSFQVICPESSYDPCNINPGISEICGNQADDDCDGLVDEGCGCGMTVNAGNDESTFFSYSADQTVTHTTIVSGGTAPYSYSWTMNRPLSCNQVNSAGDEIFMFGTCANTVCPSSGQLLLNPVCTGSASVKVKLMDTTEVCVTVTDANGCTTTDCFMVNATDARCFAGYEMQITGVAGRISYLAQGEATSGNNYLEISTSELKPGVYFIRFGLNGSQLV